MNQHDQMLREALRMYMSAGSGNSTDFDIQAKAWSMAQQALSHVNETPKNEHDSDDVLKRAPLVRLTDDLASSLQTAHFLIEALNQGKEITYSHKSIAMHQIRDSLQRYEDLKKMDAMERVNGGANATD